LFNRWSAVCIVSVLLLAAGCARSERPSGVAGGPPTPAASGAPGPSGTSDSAGGAADQAPLRPPVTVRIGLVVSSSDAGIFIAQERGYFREEGIDLEPTPFQSLQPMIPALASGQLDVGGGAFNTALVNAVRRGVPLKIVADKGSMPPGFGFQALLVSKALVDSGQFAGCESFRRAKIAVTAQGTVIVPALDAALNECGLSIEQIELTLLAYPDMVAALARGAIDAAMLNEPFVTTAVTEGIAAIYKRSDEFYPHQQSAVIVYGPQFMADQPAAARRFMVAYLRGVRDHYAAFVEGRQKAEIIDILARTTPVKDTALYERMVPPGLNPDGYVNLQTMARDMEWWVRHGQLDAALDAAQLVDHSYVEYALARLGRFASGGAPRAGY
jgi:NitT/TauT family transport system substrate-binding protein